MKCANADNAVQVDADVNSVFIKFGTIPFLAERYLFDRQMN